MKETCKCGAEPFESCGCYMPAHPKPGGKKKSLGKKRKHLSWVASQGCMIPNCLESPNVHHIRILGESRDDKKTIPLCYNHHQGPEGIHFLGKHAWRKKYGHELDMLNELMKRDRE